MKIERSIQKWLTCTMAVLLCGACTMGCNSRKSNEPVANKPKETQPDGDTKPTLTENASEAGNASETPDANEADSSSQTPTPPKADAAVSANEMVVPAGPPETWSVQRFVALAASGPIVIDVSVNIGGKSLDEAASAATGRAIARIEKDLEKPWTWSKLVEHPLIRSGWLGNLVADAEQREQLIAQYNKDGDDEVEDEELNAFLTRGLSGKAAMQFSDMKTEPNQSPWEKLDANGDSFLDQAEIANIAKVVAALDLNADQSVTLAEIQASRATMSAQAMRSEKHASSFDWATELTASKIRQKLFEKYNSFSTAVARDQWQSWSDERWNLFDKDNDGQLADIELLAIATVQPDLEFKIKFQSMSEAGCALSATASGESGFAWNSRLNTSGQVTGKLGAIAVVVKDSYTATNRNALRQNLAAAIADPQIAGRLQTALMLKEGAFDLLDADNDDKLSDEEFENAWDWLSAIRGNRILARWMYADSAWFRLADTDADGRATEMEVQKLSSNLIAFDQDKDGVVSPIEVPHIGLQIPFAMQLEITRSDDRLNAVLPNPSETPTAEAGWFASSDSNNDGAINKSEFLGSNEDFSAYDTDNDGFITASEAYKNPSARVQ